VVADLLFDPLHGTDTTIERPDPVRQAQGRGTEHEPINPVIFDDAIRGLAVSARESTFLDLGAGKGRAVMLAVERGYRKAIGVEVSPRLSATAARNLRRLPRTATQEIELATVDAATYRVPDDVSVVFLFNPFSSETLAGVVQRIGESLRRRSRTCFVVYVYPPDSPARSPAGQPGAVEPLQKVTEDELLCVDRGAEQAVDPHVHVADGQIEQRGGELTRVVQPDELAGRLGHPGRSTPQPLSSGDTEG
jgi:SAM-dependent methyltransferase